jgi:hypothetical protein
MEVIIMDLPMKAFCLNGYGEKIEITINEIFGFPEDTSYEGGYDFRGDLDIVVGSYEVHCKNNFFSATGLLYKLLVSLTACYNSLNGIVEYKRLWEHDFQFVLKMTGHGHAVVEGEFRERPDCNNNLVFEMETDQTCILSTINDLKKVAEIFGDNTGKRTL